VDHAKRWKDSSFWRERPGLFTKLFESDETRRMAEDYAGDGETKRKIHWRTGCSMDAPKCEAAYHIS